MCLRFLDVLSEVKQHQSRRIGPVARWARSTPIERQQFRSLRLEMGLDHRSSGSVAFARLADLTVNEFCIIGVRHDFLYDFFVRMRFGWFGKCFCCHNISVVRLGLDGLKTAEGKLFRTPSSAAWSHPRE